MVTMGSYVWPIVGYDCPHACCWAGAASCLKSICNASFTITRASWSVLFCRNLMAWNIDVWIFCADLSIFCKSESLMSELQLGDWNSFGDGGYLHLEMIGDGRRQFQVCQKVFTNYSTEPLFVAKVCPCMPWPWASISLLSVCSLRLAHAFSFVPEIDGIQALIKRQLLALLSLYHTVPEAVIQTFVLPPIKI